jgi:hypothetical protein
MRQAQLTAARLMSKVMTEPCGGRLAWAPSRRRLGCYVFVEERSMFAGCASGL